MTGAAIVAAALALAAACGPVAPDFFDITSPCASPAGVVDGLPESTPQTAPIVPRRLQGAPAPAWSSSRGLAVAGGLLYVVDRANGALVVLDAGSLAVQRTVAVGAHPDDVVLGPDGAAWVSVRHDGVVAVIEPGAAVVSRKVAVGAAPIGLALSPDGGLLFVALAGEGRVGVFDAATGAERDRVPAGARPRALTVVGVQGSDALQVSVANQVGPAFAFRYQPSAATTQARVQGAGEVPLRAANPAQRESLPFFDAPLPEGKGVPGGLNQRAWRALSAAIMPETGATLMAHVLVAPGDGATLLQGLQRDAQVDPQQPTKAKATGGYGSSGAAQEFCSGGTPPRPIELTVSASVAGQPAPVEQEFAIADPLTGRSFLTRFDQPADILHHPTLSLAFVAAYGTDNVLVLNTGVGDPMRMPLAELRVGMAPRALALSADGARLFVLNDHGFSVSEVDLGPLLALAVDAYQPGTMPPQLGKGPLLLQASRELPFAADPLPSEVRLGRRIFTHNWNDKLSPAARFACASCHLEGDEDKLTWFIADGPRQTPALAGRLLGTAPFNWAGDEAHLRENMDRTVGRMGGKGLSSIELAALERFLVEGLVAPPNPNVGAGGLSEAQQRGKALFFDPQVGCAGCHSGAAFTDGQLWDVGTATETERKAAELVAQAQGGKPRQVLFNTPSLLGVWHSAPYLHDGRAATLGEALDHVADGAQRGAALSEAQRGDLVAYLRTL